MTSERIRDAASRGRVRSESQAGRLSVTPLPVISSISATGIANADTMLH